MCPDTLNSPERGTNYLLNNRKREEDSLTLQVESHLRRFEDEPSKKTLANC